MGLLTLFDNGRPRHSTNALLVVGVHREERAFGEAVAERLPSARFELLRIEQGLSGRRPTPDRLAAYRHHHRVLYEQILERIRPWHRVVLDLHTGSDEAGPCADCLCADNRLLRCIEHDGDDAVQAKLRPVRLVDDQLCNVERVGAGDAAGNWPLLRPDVPNSVWRAASHLYIGLEVYLPEPRVVADADADFAAAVTQRVADWGLALTGAKSG